MNASLVLELKSESKKQNWYDEDVLNEQDELYVFVYMSSFSTLQVSCVLVNRLRFGAVGRYVKLQIYIAVLRLWLKLCSRLKF